MEKKELTLRFGEKYRVGNFVVIKYNKVLKKQEVAQLRNQLGIPEDIRKHLQRAQLPFVKVSAVSGIWGVEFCCNTNMYMFLDMVLAKALKAEQDGVTLEHNTVADFAHLFAMMYTDTCVLGDSIYSADKGNALKAFMARQKAFEGTNESPEEKAKDDEALKTVEEDEETKATIVDMASRFKKGGEHE